MPLLTSPDACQCLSLTHRVFLLRGAECPGGEGSLKLTWQSGVQVQGVSCLSSILSWAVTEEYWGRNPMQYAVMPKNDGSCEAVVGAGTWMMASTFV